MTVVADTNIYISALNFGGAPHRLLDMARDGVIDLYISDGILEEILRVQRDKFRESPEDLEETRRWVTSFTKHISPIQNVEIVRDKDDNKVLECALAANANFLVTGDKDLLDLEQFQGVKICKVSELLALL